MSIKSAIKRLENHVSKNQARHSKTFLIPYRRGRIQEEMAEARGLEISKDTLHVFVIDYASSHRIKEQHISQVYP